MTTDYFSVEALSASGIKQLLRSPAHYRAWMDEKREPTAAMQFGTVAHSFILEGVAEYGVKTLNWATKEGKEEKAKLEALGKPIISVDDQQRLYDMHETIDRHKLAKHLIINLTHIEHEIFFNIHGVPCKAKIDGIIAKGDGTYRIVDLKTCQDASMDGFAQQIRKYRYDIQAMFYRRAVAQHFDAPIEAVGFDFIAVETAQPHAVSVYGIEERHLSRATADIEAALARYARCIKDNKWPAYSDDKQQLTLWSEYQLAQDTIADGVFAEDF
jgi:exodeoxyribonuclease VIII